MNYKIETDLKETKDLSFREMPMGSLGKIVTIGLPQSNYIVLKCYNCIVCLDDPTQTWAHDTRNILVNLLSSGETITLIAK